MKKKKSVPLIRLTESPEGRRKMHVSRDFLERIVREEISSVLREGDDEDEEGGKKPKVDDASKDGKAGKGRKTAADAMPQGSRARPDPVAEPQLDPLAGDDQEVPDEEDPADDDIESNVPDGGAEDDERLSDELVGKTIQSVTMEPKSKVVPGAQELVLTFNEIADPLKIIITKSGEVRFFFRGGLHNLI